ncbi:MAG: N-acetylmuramoyl-L-alanine amidase [Wenzhouxiangellaceae bacterium]|nr:N-acetylmuramoyl-L-alanine amidase [Wenzhouxiangellaceae bacterium]
MDGVTPRPLSYVDRLETRDPAAVELIVIHATELPDLATARAYGERIHYPESRTGNSGHFYIDRDGRIEQWVPLARVAHHVSGHNRGSIGIELVNRGRWPNWYASDHQHWLDDYPDAQIDALVRLLSALRKQLPGIRQIAGHDQLDTRTQPAEDQPEVLIRRKLDPGPGFPWAAVIELTGLARWTEADHD